VLPQRGVSYCESAYDAAREADALLILTDWQEFSTLDLGRLRALLAYPIVVDGRNLYDPATMSTAGFNYYSIGRPALAGETRVEPRVRVAASAAPVRRK
jgi:UDPglucose 6-dehydrogenase